MPRHVGTVTIAVVLPENNKQFCPNTHFMETIIKVHPSELDSKLLDRIRSFIGKNENIDVTISLTEFDADYTSALNRSIEESHKKENHISFTLEEFIAYVPEKK